jgi:hypothetical protein
MTGKLLASPADREHLGEGARLHARNYSWDETGRQFAAIVSACRN